MENTVNALLLDVAEISKSFGGLMALNHVSFQVHQGDILGLIGPNGAGKTTLFNCITGVYTPGKGNIFFAPHDRSIRTNNYTPDKITALGIARTFQNIRLFTDLTALDNVRIGCHSRTQCTFWGAALRSKKQQAEEAQIIDAAMHWLDFVGLHRKVFSPAGNLAYGDQRRLEIARALASRPRLLMLDEPAAGMNPQETSQLMALITAIVDTGVSVVLIEHDMKLVMNLCRRLVVLNHGIVIAQGPPEAIRRNKEVIEAYLGRGARHA